MTFIDSLEKLLLKAGAKLSFAIYQYEKGQNQKEKCFYLLFERRIYKPKDKEILKNGILSLIRKLKEDNYQDKDYDLFHLDLISDKFFDEILKLNPTSEELFDLYKKLGYGASNKLYYFLNLIKDKEERIKYFIYGHNYRNNRSNEKTLRGFVNKLKNLNLTDDEWINILTTHIKNSIGFEKSESKQEIIEVFVQCIKDHKKCEEFVKKILNESIQLSNLYTEKKVVQLKMTSNNLIRHFNYNDSKKVTKALEIIMNLINNYKGHFTYLNEIDFYEKNNEYNVIFNNVENESKAISTIKIIIDSIMPQLKNLELWNWYDSRDDAIMINESFKKVILNINLSDNLKENENKQKTKKL